jgi:predicted  nucleic acid-binding Zn-ribbon protein
LHEKALRVTSESLDSWNKKHQLQQGEIYSIETKKQNIRRDIESKDESLREMKEKVKQLELTLQKRKVKFESQINQNENNYSMEVMSTEQELNDLNEKNNNLDVEAKLKIRYVFSIKEYQNSFI